MMLFTRKGKVGKKEKKKQQLKMLSESETVFSVPSGDWSFFMENGFYFRMQPKLSFDESG